MSLRHHEAVLARKAPPGWRWFRLQAVGAGDTLFTGGIPGIYKRGPKTGKPKWTPPHDQYVVTRAEVDEERARYRVETGNCDKCHGEGKTLTRWSKADGATYEPCRTCGGSGKVAP